MRKITLLNHQENTGLRREKGRREKRTRGGIGLRKDRRLGRRTKMRMEVSVCVCVCVWECKVCVCVLGGGLKERHKEE